MNSEQRGERRRKRAWWLGTVLGVVGSLLFFCTFLCFEPFYASKLPDLWSQRNPSVSRFDLPPQPFDQAKWQRGYATDRIAMGKWLAGSGTLIGMTRDQVITMFGPQDYELEYEGKRQLTWELGKLDDNSLFDRNVKLLLRIDGTSKW